MIKFFRNIRKQLLKQGKTSKYIKYAIGEIDFNKKNNTHETHKIYLSNYSSRLFQPKL